MYTHPNPSPYYRPTWGYQCPPVDPPALPSLSTTALQDIVEGQQRTTNGLVSLLSQERTTTESNAREQKQQLSAITSLSQHFLTFMPDVEQKFSALESSIRANCTSPDNIELQNRVKDMVEVVASLGRIAEGFACSTGLRLVPGMAPNPWAWVPANAQPLQQDPTSFSASFTRAPRLFPAAIPNSTRSSVFAHSTGPARSVHWPSDLDIPTTTWANWSDPDFPVHFGANNPYRASRSSLCSGMRPPPSGPCAYPGPPSFRYPIASDPSPSPTPTPDGSPYTSRLPYDLRSPVPIVPPSLPPGTVPPPRPISAPSQTESVVGSLRRLSTITERTSESFAVPPPPAFGRAPANGPSPSTSSIETFSTPSGISLNPPAVPPSRFSVSTAPSGQVPPNWFGTIYPRTASTVSSVDGYTMPSPPSPQHIEIPDLRPADTVRWSSLFPSAPIVVERPALDNLLLRSSTPAPEESVASPMSSPVRSIVSYAGSTNPSMTSAPMTPLSHASGKFNLAATHPNRLTTDLVVPPKAPSDETTPSTSAVPAPATASTSTVAAPTPALNPLAIQLVSFFFDTVQRLFKVPGTVDLSYGGFEVAFSTDSIAWEINAVDAVCEDLAERDRRVFELMPAPANAALYRYMKDLARVRMDLAALQVGEGEGKEDPAVEQLMLRVKAEQETVQSWVRRVCSSAGALSIADPKFSPRK
ncbi:hypothetical protein EDB87DRAFT_1606636 [Lactarius vividus]|nr:hypothetical protein EDB87DRAFT_1606636 [Lactarius vividus]